MRRNNENGISIIELLVVMAVVAVLALLVVRGLDVIKRQSVIATCLSNMKKIGTAFQMYANDHDQQLPGRARSVDPEAGKWPRLLHDRYLKDKRVYAAPGLESSYLVTGADPLSDRRNNTSFIMNGYNDLGAFEDETVIIRTNLVSHPTQTILLGMPRPRLGNFYMDFVEGEFGNHVSVLDLEALGGGSTYLFFDGSARFLKPGDYKHELWLVNKSGTIPPPTEG